MKRKKRKKNGRERKTLSAVFKSLDNADKAKDAKHHANDVVDTNKATYETEDKANNGQVRKKANEPTENSNYNEEDNKLDKEGCEITLFDLEGRGPELLKKIHK